MHRTPPMLLIVILVLAVLAGAYYFFFSPMRIIAATTNLSASGTVETTEIAIAPEISGKVSEVMVNEGDTVKKGDVLFSLDGTLLQAQRAVAQAALDTARSSVASANAAVATANASVDSAQAQYDLALTTALNEEKASRASDWPTTSAPNEFDQPSWYFDRAEQITGVQAEVDQAKTGVDSAAGQVDSVEKSQSSSDFLAAEQRLIAARVRFNIAKQVRDHATGASSELEDAARTAYDDADSELSDAQKAYDRDLTTSGADDVLQARARLRVAQERYDAALDQMRLLQTGKLSPKVTAAQKVVDQAKAAASQAQTTADQAAQAIKQAEANLALIDAQITRLRVTAPDDAVVLKRAIEPGEVANPGAPVLTLGRQGDLTITVYIPEDRYGEIKLGQKASVEADSFPGRQFDATVTHIADRAEFTPRNVQTVEGRKTTVFAIKLLLNDPEAMLKSGMPADVHFQ
jgi:HlyD family secretion protein